MLFYLYYFADSITDNDGGTSGIEMPGAYTHKIEINKDCTINIIAEYTGKFAT
ncbi:MAG TPA: hypothetical protein IAA62_02905 [Candidatus Caccopulliclostridium gallistercoris]|uniref:Uncharacterized protein n=1 Tax=Candidatus Caccopulliclostridium gallistercoris TaxID=2840719 RepID=A0A9D1NE80_9FIRM|nr:hypothetical protein [Candidatus Caccopulliclostridium gallistercoris]